MTSKNPLFKLVLLLNWLIKLPSSLESTIKKLIYFCISIKLASIEDHPDVEDEDQEGEVAVGEEGWGARGDIRARITWEGIGNYCNIMGTSIFTFSTIFIISVIFWQFYQFFYYLPFLPIVRHPSEVHSLFEKIAPGW